MFRLIALAPMLLAAPLAAQLPTAAPATAPTPEPIDPALNLTDKEKSTLTRCNRLTEQERAQSSKCSEVMKKAGKADPATQRQTTPEMVPG